MKRSGLVVVSEMTVNGRSIRVARKSIKNVYLRFDRSSGALKLSVPSRMPEADIVRFIHAHEDWIARRLSQFQHKPPQPAPTFTLGETHPVFGVEYVLNVVQSRTRSRATIGDGDQLTLRTPQESSIAERAAAIDRLYRDLLVKHIPAIIECWQPVMGVQVAEWRIRKMKTRWGTCNMRARRIWLNLELAKFPPECLEYVVVHEMNHLLERGHTSRFYALMDTWLPDWRVTRKLLADRQVTDD